MLEQLPASSRGNVLRSFTQSPRSKDPTLAVSLARIYIERSRAEADPRMLGYAQGVLAPWWNADDAPAETTLLRATIRQARHEFNPALKDLDLVLRVHPDSAQAWLTRATILRVQGRYAEAGEACAQLRGNADPFVAELCSQTVLGMSGKLPESLQALTAMQPAAARQPPTVRAWFDAEFADMLERSGRDDDASAAYAAALQRDGADLSLRAAYADFLLDHDRAAEVVPLTESYDRVDALRLRWLIALTRLNQPRPQVVEELATVFAAAHRRGEDLHLREEARFELEVRHDAPRALALALKNWTVQHEPWDARLVIDAAHQAGRAQDAQPVLDWLEPSHLQDARLARLRDPAAART